MTDVPRDTNGEPLAAVFVHAHPDDESSKGAATMARYVAEGVRVVVATCTGGERGDILNPALDLPEVRADIAGVRRREMDAAREALGVEQQWLGWMDSGLPEGDPLPPLPDGCFALMDVDEAALPLVRILRDVRPQVLVTYDENGGYPHPDHIMCHQVSMRAAELAADVVCLPGEGEPWRVAKIYYHMTFHRRRLAALDEAMHDAGLEPVYTDWLASMADGDDMSRRVTTRVPCADFFPVRDKALRAHATQVDPNGSWFAVPLTIAMHAYPTEDYELASSTVLTAVPEEDLFDGLRASA